MMIDCRRKWPLWRPGWRQLCRNLIIVIPKVFGFLAFFQKTKWRRKWLLALFEIKVEGFCWKKNWILFKTIVTSPLALKSIKEAVGFSVNQSFRPETPFEGPKLSFSNCLLFQWLQKSHWTPKQLVLTLEGANWGCFYLSALEINGLGDISRAITARGSALSPFFVYLSFLFNWRQLVVWVDHWWGLFSFCLWKDAAPNDGPKRWLLCWNSFSRGVVAFNRQFSWEDRALHRALISTNTLAS